MVKTYKKLILPVLLLLIIYLVYSTYFAPKQGLGSFRDFSTNNTASKKIRVLVVHERGFTIDPKGEGASFFAKDRLGIEVKIFAINGLPEGIDSAKTVILNGHMHQDNFEASEVVVE
ncbi:hypothetical protein BMS3Abin03_00767 [bacterium BMS3Abin03]|nr:hypothetical protein BMS3Abin03_00767 [bacterium BMS3Abin03]HDZ58865.1 hypothetical protein [Ignavibacteriales bacterium]